MFKYTADQIYAEAIGADLNYQDKLVEIYGNRAGDMRYQSHKFTDEDLLELRRRKLAADARWLDAMQTTYSE